MISAGHGSLAGLALATCPAIARELEAVFGQHMVAEALLQVVIRNPEARDRRSEHKHAGVGGIDGHRIVQIAAADIAKPK